LKYLEKIDLGDCSGISEDGLYVLLESCTTIKCLGIKRCSFATDEILSRILMTLPILEELDLESCKQITADFLDFVELKNGFSLRFLHLSGVDFSKQRVEQWKAQMARARSRKRSREGQDEQSTTPPPPTHTLH